MFHLETIPGWLTSKSRKWYCAYEEAIQAALTIGVILDLVQLNWN
jgi:hypothetical protein